MTDILREIGVGAALPEIFLALAAMALLMFGVFRKGEGPDLTGLLALGALGLATILVILAPHEKAVAFGGSFVTDTFARTMKALMLFGSSAAIVLSSNYMRVERIERFEYHVLILLASVGMMVMISANSLISLYLGLELTALSLYVVAAINRDDARSSEAGLKYFVLGALSSGMLLYGASLVYGFTGAVVFSDIAAAIKANGAGLGLVFGVVFIIAGLAFKVSAVPFHMWTPDVYEGAPTPVTAFFAAAPKVAAMALFVRAMVEPFPASTWQQVVIFISIASMGLGAFAAIGQDNIKRLLAYSSIGNVGYALVGLAAANTEGVRSVVIYMLIYMIATLGAFACVIAMRRRGLAVERVSDLAGLARNDATLAFVFAMLMFSLAGIPPLAGFFAKFYVFMAAVKAGLLALAIVGVVASVIGAFYYLRIVKVMYFDDPAEAFDPAPGEVRLVALVSGAFVLAFILFAQPVLYLAQAAAVSLF
jgi:NADH-quinone oxidoreductase subunit N